MLYKKPENLPPKPRAASWLINQIKGGGRELGLCGPDLRLLSENRAFFRAECRTPDSMGSYVSELTPYRTPGWFALENRSVCGGNGHSPLTLTLERTDSGIKPTTFLST